MGNKTIHIILWHYNDKSAFGVVRAYSSQDAAEYDLDMLKEHSDSKQFELVSLPIEGV